MAYLHDCIKNIGITCRWNLCCLCSERRDRKDWMNSTTKAHYLTDDDITRFVECLCPFVQQAICNVHGKDKMVSTARLLAWLRPQTIIPPILDRYNYQVKKKNTGFYLVCVIVCGGGAVDILDKYFFLGLG